MTTSTKDILDPVDPATLRCSCELERRQADENQLAKDKLRDPKTLWHLPSCKINMAQQLRKVQREIREMDQKMCLPDPIIEALDAKKRKDLVRNCKRLRTQMGV